MEDDSAAAGGVDGGSGGAVAAVTPSPLPEVELYSYLLVLVFALDKGDNAAVRGGVHAVLYFAVAWGGGGGGLVDAATP